MADVVTADLDDKIDHQQSLELQSEDAGLVMNTLGLTALGIYHINDWLLVITFLLSRLLATLLCCFPFWLESSY